MKANGIDSKRGLIGLNTDLKKTNLYMSSAKVTKSDQLKTRHIVPAPKIEEIYRLHNKV
jgi:hypothetical protein